MKVLVTGGTGFIGSNLIEKLVARNYEVYTIAKDSMNIEQFILDAHELILLLLNRFNQKKLYLVDHSWGSILGTLVVSRYPEFIQAYVGIGQVVNILENEKLSYQYTIVQAKNEVIKKRLNNSKNLNPILKRISVIQKL